MTSTKTYQESADRLRQIDHNSSQHEVRMAADEAANVIDTLVLYCNQARREVCELMVSAGRAYDYIGGERFLCTDVTRVADTRNWDCYSHQRMGISSVELELRLNAMAQETTLDIVTKALQKVRSDLLVANSRVEELTHERDEARKIVIQADWINNPAATRGALCDYRGWHYLNNSVGPWPAYQ